MDRTVRRGVLAIGAALASAAAILPAFAAASPVATSDESYSVLGRVFPDPLAGCQNFGQSPCSPNAQGNFPATQFLQYQEFESALEFMNQRPEWARYMEVWPLSTGQFPGNNLAGGPEFDPKPEYKSAGLPTSTLERQKEELYVVRVTDETVPDAGKKRYTLSLSIHGIERAGAEGGTRAMEDLVTSFTTGRDDDTVIPTEIDPNAPTFADVLKKTIIYFTYPNPDGWRRGSVSEGGFFFQRYNGNGVDPNRDWPDIGYSFRPYSGMSEPETRAFAGFYKDVREHGEFAAGDDLHGMPFADALSYTLLPHGRHDYAKDERIRDAAIKIHQNSEQALAWSPMIQPSDAPRGGPLGTCVGTIAAGDACAPIYGQTWGTVYDTIEYTTTGTLGDWFDSKAGLNADGIDNEMAFSHIDRNIVFDPHGEQLHVDGNKALIYAHLANIINPPENPTFDAAGDKGYVPNTRLTRGDQVNQPDDSGQDPQASIDMGPKPTGQDRRTIYDRSDGFVVNAGNGGMRVEVTEANIQGVTLDYALQTATMPTLKVECRCDDHHGPADARDPEWTIVAEDYNQRQLYMAAGLTATVNRPQGDLPADPTDWRLVIEGPHAATKAHVEFTRGPASADGNTGGDEPPRLAPYNVANTDFFADLDPFSRPGESIDPIQPRKVLEGEQDLNTLDSLVLADDALPGYTGRFGAPVTGQPSPPEHFENGDTPSTPGARESGTLDPAIGSTGRVPNSYQTLEWTIAPEAVNQSMHIALDASQDFDMQLYRLDEEGNEEYVANGASGAFDESIDLPAPAAGTYRLYVDNYAATPDGDLSWTVDVTYTGFGTEDESGPTGDFTKEEKDAWIAELRQFVENGGNLVLTDGALQALPDLVGGITRRDISKSLIYVGQISFSNGSGTTLEDPLARDIQQPGSRFSSGFRRQTFEPTPLGFAIQESSGADKSSSPEFSVSRSAWEAAGGRYVAGATTSGGSAQPLTNQVTVGELPLGEGRIRISGSMLPQPSNQFDHPLGVEPYALTYTGYILARNLFDWESPGQVQPPEPPGGGGNDGGGQQQQGSQLPPTSGTPGVAPPAASKKSKRCKRKRAKKAGRCKAKRK
jgi:hypothetical protein